MSITLNYSNTAYMHPGLVRFVITRAPRYSEGGGRPIGYTETWDIEGTLYGDPTHSLSQQISDLESAYSQLNGDLEIKSDSTSLRKLEASKCDGGRLKITGPSYPEGNGPELATKRTYKLQVVGEVTASNLADPWTYAASYQLDPAGKRTITYSGTYNKPSGARTAYEGAYTAKFPLPSALWRQTQHQYNPNVNDSEVRFTIAQQEGYKALPANVSDGSYTRRVQKAAGGQQTLTISGSFKGSGADAAIEALRQRSLPCTQDDVVENPFDNSKQFTLSYICNPTNIIESEQTVTMQAALMDFILLPVLDGRPLVKQWTVMRPAKATQSGRMLCRSAQTVQGPLWPQHLKPGASVSTTIKSDAYGNQLGIEYSWSYSFESPDYLI